MRPSFSLGSEVFGCHARRSADLPPSSKSEYASSPRQSTKTKHQGKAAIAAGYSPKHARQSAYQALESIRKTAPELLARHGLDDDALIKKHLIPLLQATETKFFPYSSGGKRKLLTREVANHSIRKESLDMTFKIRGLYVREQENKGPEFSVVMIDASHRPDWAAMRRTQPKIEVPGLPAHVPKPSDQYSVKLISENSEKNREKKPRRTPA